MGHQEKESEGRVACCHYFQQDLIIEGLEVECFPVAGKALPTSLTTLRIWDFGKSRKLDGQALHRLKCLTELHIWDCPLLERLPEEGLSPSLGQLISINECPRPEKRCKPHKGKDWPKIHHIPRLEVNRIT